MIMETKNIDIVNISRKNLTIQSDPVVTIHAWGNLKGDRKEGIHIFYCFQSITESLDLYFVNCQGVMG